ncbi:MAG: hypothetical protein WCA23_06175, partial [Stellaceae bacterium]
AHRGGVDPTKNRKFESTSLQRRVRNEPCAGKRTRAESWNRAGWLGEAPTDVAQLDEVLLAPYLS